MDYGRGFPYGVSTDKPTLGIAIPFDKKPATIGKGVMVALGVDSRATVDPVHEKALEPRGKDEGPAGPRSEDFCAGSMQGPSAAQAGSRPSSRHDFKVYP